MDIEDLRRHLGYLIEKYISDAELKSEAYALTPRDGMPAVKAVVTILAGEAIDRAMPS
jgi:hypothetical protein